MTCVAVIQARHNSTRLPGKVTLPLAGVPVLTHMVARARRIDGVDRVAVTVPDGPGQAPLVALAEGLDGVVLSFGPENDLVRRFAIAAAETGATTVLRLWGDCPVLDPALAGALIRAQRGAGAPFATIPLDSGFPEGMEVHVMSADAIADADAEATDPWERETVFPFFERQPVRFPAVHVRHERDSHGLNLLLDTVEDHRRLSAVFDALYPTDPAFGVAAIEALAEERPEIFEPASR